MNGHFAALDAAGFPAFEPGSVWLVGAGPGAPGLISLLGYHALAEAEIIVYDALVNEALLAFGNPAAERVYAGKRGGKPSEKQADITFKLIAWAEAGKRVLRLKGGDPFIFGRGAEEAMALAARGIPFRIVPGIGEANHAVVFLTGHDETGGVPAAVDWAAVAHAAPVLVMYMAVKHLGTIAERLLAAGRSPEDRLTVVSNAALPDQRVVEATLGTVGAIADAIAAPAIVILGPVASYRQTLDWYVGSLRDNPIG